MATLLNTKAEALAWRLSQSEPRRLRKQAAALRQRALLAAKAGRDDLSRQFIAEATRLGNQAAKLAA